MGPACILDSGSLPRGLASRPFTTAPQACPNDPTVHVPGTSFPWSRSSSWVQIHTPSNPPYHREVRRDRYVSGCFRKPLLLFTHSSPTRSPLSTRHGQRRSRPAQVTPNKIALALGPCLRKPILGGAGWGTGHMCAGVPPPPNSLACPIAHFLRPLPGSPPLPSWGIVLPASVAFCGNQTPKDNFPWCLQSNSICPSTLWPKPCGESRKPCAGILFGAGSKDQTSRQTRGLTGSLQRPEVPSPASTLGACGFVGFVVAS